MLWECSECGHHLERPRPPAVCRSCGTAGAIFVEAEPGIDIESDADSLRAYWIQRGVEEAASRSAA